MDWPVIAAWSERLLFCLGDISLRHVLLLAVLAPVFLALRRRSACERYIVGVCGLSGLLIVALWPAALGRAQLRVLPVIAEPHPIPRTTSPTVAGRQLQTTGVQAVETPTPFSGPPPRLRHWECGRLQFVVRIQGRGGRVRMR